MNEYYLIKYFLCKLSATHCERLQYYYTVVWLRRASIDKLHFKISFLYIFVGGLSNTSADWGNFYIFAKYYYLIHFNQTQKCENDTVALHPLFTLVTYNTKCI